MISLKRIIFGVVWLVTIFLIGSFGYVVLEGWSIFEGFYMTVITLTTVGYGEVRPLTQTGRTFTIMLIFLGVGFMFYVVTAIAQVVVEGQLRDVFGRRRLEREIRNIKDHYIICGFGRIGEVIARELATTTSPSWWWITGRSTPQNCWSDPDTCTSSATPPRKRCCWPRASSGPGD